MTDAIRKDETEERAEELNRLAQEKAQATDPLSIARAAKNEAPEGDGKDDEDEIETAEKIGFASEAGNR